jgi:hypothetical protein
MTQKQVRKCRLSYALTANDADDGESEAGILCQELKTHKNVSLTRVSAFKGHKGTDTFNKITNHA